MAGTVSKIIDRIKNVRSSGNPVVALTVETRLVLQGFDPERFDADTPDDAGQLARLREIAREMKIDIDDLLGEADVEPDSGADPAPPPKPPRTTARSEDGVDATGVVESGSGEPDQGSSLPGGNA